MKSRNLMSPLHVSGMVCWWCHKILMSDRVDNVVLALGKFSRSKFCQSFHRVISRDRWTTPSFVSFDSLRTYLSNIAIEWK